MLLSAIDLQILVRLSEGLTQSQIGNELGLEQPAVSKAVHAAEQRMGLSLVSTDGRRVKLTNVGREIARSAAGVLMQVRALDDLVATLRAGRTKHTRIIASSTPGTYLLPPIVAAFLHANPDAHIDVEVVPMGRLWNEFLSGAYDIAFTPRLPFTGALTIEPVYVDPVVFFVGRNHRLAARGAVTFADLQTEQVVGKFTDAYWGRVHYDLQQRGHTFAQSIDLSSAEAVKRIVMSGAGVGLLFASALAAERLRGDLVPLHLPEPAYEQTYFIVHPELGQTPLAARICDYVRGELRPAVQR